MPCWSAHSRFPQSSPAAHLRGTLACLFATALCLPAGVVHGQPGAPAHPALQGLRPLSEVPVLETSAELELELVAVNRGFAISRRPS